MANKLEPGSDARRNRRWQRLIFASRDELFAFKASLHPIWYDQLVTQVVVRQMEGKKYIHHDIAVHVIELLRPYRRQK